MPETIAIIPARAGSERVPGKNTRMLAGHPLLAYSIAAAVDSGVCNRVVVSTDSEAIAEIARDYGADVPGLRPSELATSDAHDIGFLRHAMEMWCPGEDDQLWVILRPTSPLRTGNTVEQAHRKLVDLDWADSIRALRPVAEHPSKMWRYDPATCEASTYIPGQTAFNGPISQQEPLFVQASSLEIVRRKPALEHNSIAGASVAGFVMPESESHDINTPHDWIVLEHLVADNPDVLPRARKGL